MVERLADTGIVSANTAIAEREAADATVKTLRCDKTGKQGIPILKARQQNKIQGGIMQTGYSETETDFTGEENARRNRKRADMVDRGIDMALGQGFASAERFMQAHPDSPDILAGILRRRLDRHGKMTDEQSVPDTDRLLP